MNTKQLNFTEAKVKIQHRSRNRMKLTIKLGAEAAEGFKQFMAATKPAEITEDDFVLNIFYHGCDAFQEKLAARVKEFAEMGNLPEGIGEHESGVEVNVVGDSVPLDFGEDNNVEEV